MQKCSYLAATAFFILSLTALGGEEVMPQNKQEDAPLATEDEAAATEAAKGAEAPATGITAAKATLTEEEIRDRLEKAVSVEWQEMPIQDVCREIATLAGVSVILDPAADKEITVTLSLQGARLANVLAWLSELTHLHYQIRDQAIFLTPQPTGERILVIYPVADILRPPKDAYPPGEEPEEEEERRAPTSEEMQELIKKFVAPGTWQ